MGGAEVAMTNELWSTLLGPLGTLALALLIIWSFLKGWIVPGWVYREVSRERDRLFSIAVPATRALEQGAEAMKQQSSRRNVEDRL